MSQASYTPQPPYQGPDAASRVAAPAITLMVVAGIGAFLQVVSILFNVLGMGLGAAASRGEERFLQMFSGGFGIAISLVGIAVSGLIFYGALKMKNLESYGLALASAIVAMIPCVSPCCVLGLPVGIWALVVLLNENVKAAFRG